jgi:hypothetical protein
MSSAVVLVGVVAANILRAGASGALMLEPRMIARIIGN